MLVRCLITLCLVVPLAAQGQPSKKSPAGDGAARSAPAASGPKRFTAFPVPDAPPLDVAKATKDAVAAMLALQEGEGDDQWPYQGVYREDRSPSPVGYRVGGTSIAILGLLSVPGYRSDKSRQEVVERGLRFVLKTLEVPRMQEDFVGNYDVRGWAHCYGLRFLLAAKKAGAVEDAQKDAVDAAVAFYLDALKRTEIPEVGGWQYARGPGLDNPCPTSPFMTAPCLLALLEARAAGLEVADELIARTARALEITRGESGYVAYNASRPTRDDPKQIPGAVGRMCAVEVALARAGKGDEARLRNAVERFFEFWPELEKRRKKQGTHVAPYGVAPYYFFYAFTHAAAAIELLPEAERAAGRARFRELLFKVRDADGTWNDRVFPRSASFGTSMSILALLGSA